MDRQLITLLTDFGLRDGFVGAMKGVIATLAPAARVVDISHEIEPQGVRRGGLVWAQATPYFPDGSIHVAVVDPGVGSRRKIIALRSKNSIFLAPDNGMVGYVLKRRQIRAAVEVRPKEHCLQPLSATFHGRDVFAPVAAKLAKGLPLQQLGPALESFQLETLPPVRRRRREGTVEDFGQVVDVDRFGNATTNIRPPSSGRFVAAEVGAHRFSTLRRSYASVRKGRPLVIVGSLGYVEIAVNQGSAAAALGLTPGSRVRATWRVA